MSTTDVSSGLNPKQNKNAASSVFLPEIPTLRVASELQLLYAVISSFAQKRDELFFPGGTTKKDSDVASQIGPHFIHLLSKGDNQDLLSDDNRCHLFRLGVGILKFSGMWSAAEAAENQFKGPAARDDQYSKDWWISQDLQDDAAVDELKKLHTELLLGKELNADLLNCKQARYPDIWKAVMIGYLCLKINRNGFGAREEDALRILGGEPDAFRAVIDSQFKYIGESSPVDPKGVRLLSIRNNSQRADVAKYTADFLKQHGLFYFDSNGSVWELGLQGWFDRLINGKRNPINLSSRFQGYTEEDIKKTVKDPRIQKILIGQIRAAHKAMMQGPPASGERQILPGIWASTIKDDISRYSEQPLNRLDLSNCDMSEVDLFRRQLEGCRFDGTNLRGANCRETKFGGSRFSDADLTGALLKSTDLRGCDLSTANLSHVGWLFKPPILDGYTKFFPDDCRTPSDVRKHLNRFQGWDEEMVDEFLELASTYKLSPTQRRSFRQLKDILLNPKQSPILLATSAEILTITSAIGTTSEEAQKALSRISRLTDSAGIPVLRDHDFSNQDLTNRPLRGAFMERVSLNGASLAGKDLRGAVISNSDLRGANLKGADLSGALLVNVDLTGADLSEVNLTETKLINCLIDEVKLDRVKMINTEMQQSTFANVTITEGIIEDLIVCQSYLHDINFVGSAEGSGLLVSGLALVDSVGLNLQFSGNTELTQLQLMGSLGLGSGADEAELIIEGSEWHDQLVQVVTDPDLGVLEHGLEVTRVRTRNTNSPNRPLRRNGPDQTSTAFLVRMLVSRGGDLMGSYPILEHLERLTIGYQAGEVQRDEKNQISPQLILPASFTRGQ